MNKAKFSYEALLSSETLSLKQIINMAWSADPGGYPYPEMIFEYRNRDLHYAIVSGELEGVPHSLKRHDRVCVGPLWNYLTAPERKDKTLWEPLRDFCLLWAQANGTELIQPTTNEENDAASTPTRRARASDTSADVLLKNRIEMVIAKARTRWPKAKNRPPIRAMARELYSQHGKELGYRAETIKKILHGTYRASQRLGIPGL